MDSATFFQKLFGNLGAAHYVSLWRARDKKSLHFSCDQLEALASTAAVWNADGDDPYFSVCAHDRDLGPERGSEANKNAITCLWADVDFGTEGHSSEAYPPDIATAKTVLEESGLPAPSILTETGHGLHPIWLITEPLILTSNADRRNAKKISNALNLRLVDAGKLINNYKVDNVRDLARMLRVPNTTNRKVLTAPREVRVIESIDRTYSWSELVDLLGVQATGSRSSKKITSSRQAWTHARFASALESANRERVNEATNLTPYEIGQRLCNGESLAEAGARDSALWQAACVLACCVTEAPVDAIENFAHASVEATGASSDCKQPAGENFRTKLERAIRNRADDVADDAEDPPDDRRPHSSITDAVLAERFIAAHSANVHFVCGRDWVIWDGKRWATPQRGELYRMILSVIRDTRRDLKTLKGKKARGAAARFLDACESYAKMKGILNVAQTLPNVTILSSELDTHAELLNVGNGTVNLRTGELLAHDPSKLITRFVDVNYVTDSVAPRWGQFLQEVFCGVEDLVQYVQRAVGYSLTGSTNEQAFFLMHGAGSNGKGRFVRQLQALAGDAARTTPFTTFTVDRAKTSGNTPELAVLHGARVVVAGEPDEGVRLSESTIKSLTGQDVITACAKYEAPFEYAPQFKIWLHTNHTPEIRGTDNGVWRRPRLIPFNAKFADGKADPLLDDKLDAEREGILRWAVDGAIAWFRQGLGRCKDVDDATAEFRHDSDALAPFIEDELEARRDGFASNEEVYLRYTSWCSQNGQVPWPKTTLCKRLKARGYIRAKKGAARGFADVAVKPQGHFQLRASAA